jgi:UPF0042 nucleotide-binding protein
MKVIIISGRSGAGKSVALHVLEDLGYTCLDGVPFQLFDQIAVHLSLGNNKIAFIVDVRNLPQDIEQIKSLLADCQSKLTLEIIYLDADNSELIRRFSETRRLHPLSKNNLSLSQALDLETTLLKPICKQATLTIDTTTLSVHNLNEHLKVHLQGSKKSKLLLVVQSFGFKYTHPVEADYLFDVRFLPNPHWEEHLRVFTGKDQPVIDYLDSFDSIQQTIKHIENLFYIWLPMLEENNRSYVTISIGCTGGKHRSVYIAEKIAARFKHKYQVQIEHKSLKNIK